MKLFSFHSPAVRPLWEIFKASVPPSFELVPVEVPREFDGPIYGEDRFWGLSHWMVGERIRLAQQHMGEWIAISGCDQLFFKDCANDLILGREDAELITASDRPGEDYVCCDFQIVKGCEAVLALYKRVYDECRLCSDEEVLNRYRYMVRLQTLPHDRYWNLALAGRWKKGDVIPPPPAGLMWFHANYTVGLEDKLALLTAMQAHKELL